MPARNEALLQRLNSSQQAAARCDQHTLIVAGPGSGKTQTMASATAYLLSDGVSTVTNITFTREAAKELRERVLKFAGNECKDRLLVSTFASLCNSLIQPPRKRLEFGSQIFGQRPKRPELNIVPGSLQMGFVSRAARHVGSPGKYEDWATEIEVAKSELAMGKVPAASDLFDAYSKILSENKFIDLQDLTILALQGLRDGSIGALNTGFVLIDEMQDTDPAQYALVNIQGERGSVLVGVGDDDQSIYSWRKASGVRGMTEFRERWGAKVVELDVNYRSYDAILKHAGMLMTWQSERLPKSARAAKGEGGEVLAALFDDVHAEHGDALAQFELVLESEQSMAVIARTNRDLDAFELRARARGLPIYRLGGKSIMDLLEVGICLEILRALAASEMPATDTILSWAGVNEADLSKIRRLGSQFLGLTKDYLIKEGISEDGGARYRTVARKFAEWTEAFKAGRLSLMTAGVVDWLHENKGKQYVLPPDVLVKAFTPPAGLSFAMFLARFDRKPKAERPSNALVLTTAHSSKGLEFDYVWITGANSGSWPADNVEVDEVEEERRLFYVALTRARLWVMVAKVKQKKSSRFLNEAAIPTIEWLSPATKKDAKADLVAAKAA